LLRSFQRIASNESRSGPRNPQKSAIPAQLLALVDLEASGAELERRDRPAAGEIAKSCADAPPQHTAAAPIRSTAPISGRQNMPIEPRQARTRHRNRRRLQLQRLCNRAATHNYLI
jgi:hypothetical protein